MRATMPGCFLKFFVQVASCCVAQDSGWGLWLQVLELMKMGESIRAQSHLFTKSTVFSRLRFKNLCLKKLKWASELVSRSSSQL